MPAGLKGHIDAYADFPEAFTIITEPGKPGYCRRVDGLGGLDEELVASIMQRGVVETITVGRDGPDLIVIDGRQRVLHTAEANRRLKEAGQEPKKIPFRVARAPQSQWGLLAATANIHHQSPPSLLALQVADLEAAGHGLTEIAAAMGKKPAEVQGLRRLLDCHERVVAAVDHGIVSPTVARELAEMKRSEQVTTLEEMVAKGVTKGASARRAVAAAKAGKPVPEKPTAKRMHNQTEVQAVVDALAGRLLSAEGRIALAALRWVLRQADETEQCDELVTALNELERKKLDGKHKAVA